MSTITTLDLGDGTTAVNEAPQQIVTVVDGGIGRDGATGADGADGANGADGVSITAGSGAPAGSPAVGTLYVDTDTGDLYRFV